MAPELELESVIDTTMSVPSGIDIGIDNPNPNRDVDEHSSAGYHMRWSRLSKSVTVQAAETGLMGRASISTTFQTSTETNKKTILDQVSGSAAPGQVLCVMGPSGSGKTSLMNALSGRAKFQSGVVSLNGVVVSDAAMKRLQSKIAYVKQSDVFFDHLSVRDQLTYTALLRMKSSLTTQAKHTAVTAVLEQLRLVSVAESPIRLLSGGEKKRVNIGTELLTNPAVLLLDEPTSGLDSTSAVSLLTMLRHLAIDQKKTVMTSIHQPSSGVFFAFDKLLLLSKGSVVYFGTPLESLNYLKLKQLECPAGYNAADHWMDLLVTDPAVEPERLEKKHDSQSPRLLLQQAWDKEAVAEQMDACLIDNSNNGQGTDTTSTTMDLETSKYNTSWATQYRILTHRALKNSRSAIFTTLNLTKSLVTGAIAGMLWFQLEYTEKNVNDIRSYYFFTMTFWVFDSMFGALTAFPTERAVITRFVNCNDAMHASRCIAQTNFCSYPSLVVTQRTIVGVVPFVGLFHGKDY
jgi:ABC-type multidrug transport system ATPase subunit